MVDVLGSPGTLNMVSSWDVSSLLFALLSFFCLKESNSLSKEQDLGRWLDQSSVCNVQSSMQE